MLVGPSRFRSLALGVAFAFGVPAVVVTCGGRAEGDPGEFAVNTMPDPGRGGSGATATTQFGGQSSTATTQFGGQSSTATDNPSPTTSSSGTSGPTTGRVFLGQYAEPDWMALGLPTPQPSVTATVSRPCEERTDTCGGTMAMKTWADGIMRSCAADTKTCGNVMVAIDPQTNCIQHAMAMSPNVPFDYFLCIVTVAYHTRCGSLPSPVMVSVSANTCNGLL